MPRQAGSCLSCQTLGVMKEAAVEHWECKACNALSPTSAIACWKCHSEKGLVPTAEAAEAIKKEARDSQREANPRSSSLAFAQVLLFVAAAILVAFVVKPAYCFVAYSNGCPYKIPELKFVFLAITPFAVVAVDLALIFLVAPNTVPLAFAETYVHRNRPKFLRTLYSKFLSQSYSRT